MLESGWGESRNPGIFPQRDAVKAEEVLSAAGLSEGCALYEKKLFPDY